MWLEFVLAVIKIACVSILPSHSTSPPHPVAHKKWLESNSEPLN